MGVLPGIGGIAFEQDQYFSNVSLLLHMGGVDGSTTFIDNSRNTFSVTPSGNAQIDTAQSKFGGASALFDGTGDYLSIPDSGVWDFGSNNFTIELWVRRNGSQTNIRGLVTTYDTNGGGGWHVSFGQSGVSGTTNSIVFSDGLSFNLTSTTLVPDATWSHIAVVRSGTPIKIYQDGVETASSSAFGAVNGNTSSPLLIGFLRSYNAFNGWIDEVRVTKGIARYTAAFIPPSLPFLDQ